MKLIVLLAFGIFTIFSFIGYNVNNHRIPVRISKKFPVKRDTNHTFDFNSRKVSPLKPLRRFPSGKNNKKFVVDWKRLETLQNFVRRSGQIIGQLEFQNFNTLEKTTDVWHHRLVKAGHFEVRKVYFDFSKKSKEPRLTFDNCYDGWFPFHYFELKGPIEKAEILIKNPLYDCEFKDRKLPKTMELIDKFGSFAVRIDPICNWRYWNFDVSNIDEQNFETKLRIDLNYTSTLQVVSLKVKGFKRNLDLFDNWLIKKFRLDWIQNVGINDLDYKNGCLVFEDTDPNAVFHFHGLRQLHYDRENFKRSTPFIINSTNMGCLDFDKKIELFEKFGIVPLQILDSCPDSRKVLIIDGRQPFDYVTDRDDIKFHSGDTLLYARIRYFTEEDHLKNLDKWFMEMGYHDVTEIGEFSKDLSVPEVTVNGCISTFLPFPFAKRAIRNYKNHPTSRYTIPFVYFRNNSGWDCYNRRSVSLLRRSVGKFSVSSSRDCECGKTTSSDFFWKHCRIFRGTLEISKYHEEKDLSQYQNIHRIRDGQLWIHNTEVVSDLRSFSNLEKVNCQPGRGNRESSAVRVDAINTNLENIDLPKLTRSENCDRLVTVYGEKDALPKYSESLWMKKNRGRNLINIQQEQRKCVGYTGKGGGLSAKFAHELEGCNVIIGDLNIDGEIDDISRMTDVLQNIHEIQGNVHIKNLNSIHCNLLARVGSISGNLTYENNPFLRGISLGLESVKGSIKITRSRDFCLEFQKTRSWVAAFRYKQVVVDCPFYDDSTFTQFEDRIGKIDVMCHLGVSFIFAFFAFYMMPDALLNQFKPLNVLRWREMTELDMRLKMDRDAYLDEDSSDEEPDVMTWKRQNIVKNRLDGRDLEGEKLQKERKEYRANRRRVKLSEKMGALMRTIREKDSDSEYSGQSWLRRKQKRQVKQEEVNDVEELPFQLMLRTRQTKWVGRSKPWGAEEEANLERELDFYDELNATVKEILDDDHKEGISKKHTILDRIESEDLLSRSRFVTEYNKIENIMLFLENSVERNDERKWNKLVAIRKKLRKAALKAFGGGEKVRFDDLADRSEKMVKVERMKAGAHEQERRDETGMFAKIIVETLHWRPPKTV
ncbi:unnamed protein product [Caenorhabditis nigoni]